MASVRDIAKGAGVSIATVSRVLNDKPNVDPDTRRRVEAEVERLGYRPLVRGPAAPPVVGLVYTGDPGRIDYGAFDSALMSGIMRGLSEHHFDIVLLNLHRDKRNNESYRDFFVRKGVNGIILRTFAESRHVCEEIAEEGVSSIVVADRFENPAVNFICSRSEDESRLAVEHLIQLGHRRIALGIHQVRDTDHVDRLNGYRQALEAHGIEFDQRLVVSLVADVHGGGNALDFLLRLPEAPTAIFFTDPLATLGALHRCSARGVRVPEELSIVGFDDSDVRYHSYPAFTAICQDASQLGLEAARWAAGQAIGEEPATMHKMLSTRFEINQTTAPPASN